MFAIEHSGIEPDLMTVAKSIAGGVPLSAVIGKAEIMDAPRGGWPRRHLRRLAAGLRGRPRRARSASEKEKLQSSARSDLGQRSCARLEGAAGPVPGHRRDARAGQPWWRSSWSRNRRADSPDADLTKAVVQAAGRRGLVILGCGLYGNVIRFLAPLTISDALLKEGLNLFEQAFARCDRLTGPVIGLNEQSGASTPRWGPYARPAFASVGVWNYSLSAASCSTSFLSSAIRPSAVLIGMQS